MVATMFVKHDLWVYLAKRYPTPFDGKPFMDELDGENLPGWGNSAFLDTSEKEAEKLALTKFVVIKQGREILTKHMRPSQ